MSQTGDVLTPIIDTSFSQILAQHANQVTGVEMTVDDLEFTGSTGVNAVVVESEVNGVVVTGASDSWYVTDGSGFPNIADEFDGGN